MYTQRNRKGQLWKIMRDGRPACAGREMMKSDRNGATTCPLN